MMTIMEKTEVLKNMSEQLKNEFEAFDIMAKQLGIEEDSVKEFYKTAWNNYAKARKEIMES